jgi:hypothetical protein
MTIPLIEGNDQIRADKCMAEIQNTLVAYDCAMIPALTITANGIIKGHVKIVAKPRIGKTNPGGRDN